MSDDKFDGSVHVGPSAPSEDTTRDKIDRDLARLLNHLVHLGRDLIGAYEVAREKLEAPAFAESLSYIETEHKKQVAALSERVRDLGHTPAEHGDLRSLLEKGRVYLASLRGDREILAAMAENEKTVIEAYREALQNPGLSQETRQVLQAGITHESRHKSVYDSLLGDGTE